MCLDNEIGSPKIIVFGENHHNTLGLIRSLGEIGLFSYLVLVNSNGLYPFVAKSRYIKKVLNTIVIIDGNRLDTAKIPTKSVEW